MLRKLFALLMIAATSHAGVQIITVDDATASSGDVAVTGQFAQVSAQVGDVIVAGVAGNKKGSKVPVSLVQTDGTGTTGSQSQYANALDTYPTAWLFYQTVTQSGTFNFEWHSSGKFTGAGALYVLRSDNGQIDVGGSDIWDDPDTADNGTAYALNYSLASPLTDGVLIESINARTDRIAEPEAYTEDANGSNKRLVVSYQNVTGTLWNSAYTLSGGDLDKQTSGGAGLVFSEGTVSAPEISITGPRVQNLSADVLTNTYSIALQKGDVAVMAVAGNKSTTQSRVSFSSTAGSFTAVNTDIYPASYIAYLTASSTGTFDFQAVASDRITAHSSVYVLRSDTGAIEVPGSATFKNTDANSEADQSLTYTAAITNGTVIEAVSARTSDAIPQDVSADTDSPGKRLLCSATGINKNGFVSTYSFSGGDADKMTSSGAGVLFAPVERPPLPPEFISDPIVLTSFASGYAYSNSLIGTANDPNSDPILFSISPTETWLTVAPDGALSGTPQTDNIGTNEWTVSVTDGISGTNSATLRIEIVDETPPVPQTSQTNVVLIVIDDLGWMDLSVQGSKFYETPRIDELANSGMRFTQGYAAHPRCLPSRYGLMTGRFPGASAVPADPPDLLDEEVTLGEALQAGGYATFFAGKWHISHDAPLLPQRQGFDINITGGAPGSPPTYFFPYGNQPANELDKNGLFLDNDTPVGGLVTDRITGKNYLRTHHAGETGEYITDRLTDEAIDWMSWNADKPFFLTMSHYGVHTPYEAPQALVNKYTAKLSSMDYGDLPEFISVGIGQQKMRQNHPTYAAMIESVDTNVGRLMDQIEALGLSSNTVFIFTSDNGGLSNRGGYNNRELATSNLPLRTGKGWLYEGGIREAFIVTGPGIPPRVNSNAVVNGTDIYPTVLEITGQPLRPLDHRNGVSFKTALSGAAYDRGEPILWHSPLARPYSTGDFNSTALRDGDYKLLWFYDTPVRGGEFLYELYNVAADPGETQDLAESMPAKAADLLAQIKAWHNHEHWERSVGVIKRPDSDDVAKPPQAWVDDPTVPVKLKNGSLARENYPGYTYKLWSRTNLLRGDWLQEEDNLTHTEIPISTAPPQGFFKVETILDAEE